jgi:Raf kinase inhibitor-like YbhB/YbcL family protein
MLNDPNWRLPEVPSFELTSPDFAEGEMLPQWARSGIAGAGGDDRSPQLDWAGAPAGTKSYAVTLYDPDAPTGSGWWHWAAYNIPASVTSLETDAGNPDAGLLPEGAITLPNEIRLERYLGAAPPAGNGVHRYFFTVSALDVERLELEPGSTPALLGFTLFDHVIARAQLMGRSQTP